ncbi:unnamed protein product [Rotaria sp. Silwood2]|nr:unnamed protein product [Rotaria sp. Silwood2]CAF4070710.1 unnamed protein product [Rotaria sp. Silwood2]
MISRYEQGIGDEKVHNNYSPIYFALLCNLHQNQNYTGAAMIAFDQLNDELDKDQAREKMWHQMLDQIRQLTEEQTFSLQETSEKLFKMEINQDHSKSNNNEQIHQVLLHFLKDKLSILEKIENNRNQVKFYKEHFECDQNNNRLIFYQEMRISLSHKFTAMAVTSGDGQSEPIVKHDRTGTETM